jgi:hypothetical protein
MTLAMAGLLQQKPIHMPASNASPSICEAVEGGPFVEKRREVRYETCEAVDVSILEEESQRLPGILRDVSRSGLRIELSLAVKAGARLEVVLRNRAIIFGEARYCVRSANTYQVGVVIEDIYYPRNVPAAITHDERRRRIPQPTSTAPASDHARRLGSDHVSPDDVASFLHHDLSETKAALMERHLVACEECSRLMRMILEDYTMFTARFGNESVRDESGFGRVTLKTRRL